MSRSKPLFLAILIIAVLALLIPLSAFGHTGKNTTSPGGAGQKYAVTEKGWDDMGAILTSLGYPWTQIACSDLNNYDLLKQFDAVFVNCSSAAHAYTGGPGTPLYRYVTEGGNLYASDWAYPTIKENWPDKVTFPDDPRSGKVQNVTSSIVDPGLQQFMGTSTVPVTYDLGSWAVITGTSADTAVFMSADVQTYDGVLNKMPMATFFNAGAGGAFYTTFHNNAQASEAEKKILQYFLSVVATGNLRKQLQEGFLNKGYSSLSFYNGLVSPGGVVNMGGFNAAGGKDVLFGLNWGGSNLKLTLNTPSGTVYGEVSGTSPPYYIEVKNAPAGQWGATVTGLDVPNNNYPFVMGVGVSNAGTYPTWYLAEGTTSWGFSTYITIQNPNASNLSANVTYMPTGAANKTETVNLPANSQTTLTNDHLVSVMGGQTDFSTKVECTDATKSIAVDRTMTWTGTGAASEEAHNSVGVTSPAKTWYLPEGSSEWGFECWLLIQNPNPATANVTLNYMIEGEGLKSVSHQVEGNSRATFEMSKDIGNKDASVQVVSDIPVIPERAMYRNNRREGHDSIGTTAPANDYYLAEGATGYNVGYITYVLVQNPQASPTDVSLTYLTGSGQVAGPSFQMPANSRKTIRVNDQLPPNTDVSTKVHGSAPIIAERAMYWDNGTGEACHDSIGMERPHTTFCLPDGQTSEGRETWTLVQNPNDTDVTVDISYLTPDGSGNVKKTETIAANSRRTFGMAEHSGISGRAAIQVVSTTSGKNIMVERAMYWNSRGAGTDTIGGYSD